VFGTGSTPRDASRGAFLMGAGSTRSSMVRTKRDEHGGLYRFRPPEGVISYVLCVARCIAVCSRCYNADVCVVVDWKWRGP
jgi:hypothetical protein